MNDNVNPEAARLLLATAKTLYEKYDAGRPDPFNIFTVLRSRSDEVNLHSRFLHALLDYGEPDGGENRENLKDFLKTVVKIKDFNIRDAKVQREKDHIDLLITNLRANPPWAVVIENKIWAADQDGQLERYYNNVSERTGIEKVHMFYLTPYGHEPSEYSAGKIKGKYKCISYKDDILPWLEACQQRAVNNTRLHESLAQYMEVVRSLTGLNIDTKYMEELKQLCLEKENLRLVHDLSKAHKKACIHLVVKMWEHIKEAMAMAMEDTFKETGVLQTGPDIRISCVSENGDVTEGKIDLAPRNNNIKRHGLYYPLSPDKDSLDTAPSLGITLASDGLWYGIRCKREDFAEEFDAIEKSLRGENSYEKISRWGWYPWGRNAFVKLGIENLKIGEYPEQWQKLKDKEKVKQCAKDIAQELKEIWGKLPDDLKQDRE